MGLFNFLKGQEAKRFISKIEYLDNISTQEGMNGKVLDQLSQYEVTDDTELKIEYFFYTNTKEKAENLTVELKAKNYETREVHQMETLWSITGWTKKMKMDLKTITDWTNEMCVLGYINDCDFDGWGTTPE